MLARKVDSDSPTHGVPVDRDVSRWDVPFCHEIIPCSLAVLANQLRPRWTAAAMTVTAVVDDEDIQPGAAKSQHLIDIDGDITRIPMQVKEVLAPGSSDGTHQPERLSPFSGSMTSANFTPESAGVASTRLLGWYRIFACAYQIAPVRRR
jgi:hypothetical protein